MKPGSLVVAEQRRESVPIYARRRPERFVSTTTDIRGMGITKGLVKDVENVVGRIAPGSPCVLMGSLTEELKQRSVHYGRRPQPLVFYRLLWQGKDVWVSDGDCELREIA